MRNKPDFFLSAASEVEGDLAIPRACWVKARLSDTVRDDHMLIDIEPPIIGQKYGLGDQDVVELIVSTRHQGFSLFPITEWPSHVYIARILDRTIVKTLFFTKDQIEIIGWGMIFHTLEEASTDGKEFHK